MAPLAVRTTTRRDSIGAKDEKFFTLIGSVVFLIAALVIIFFAHNNNAWLVFTAEKKTTEFQRGLGDDCYVAGEDINCSPWGSANPFKHYESLPPTFEIKFARCLSFLIILGTSAALIYALLSCCLVQLTKGRFKFGFTILAGITVGVYLLLALVVYIARQRAANSFLVPVPPTYELSLGGAVNNYFIGFGLYVLGLLAYHADELIQLARGRTAQYGAGQEMRPVA